MSNSLKVKEKLLKYILNLSFEKQLRSPRCLKALVVFSFVLGLVTRCCITLFKWGNYKTNPKISLPRRRFKSEI